MVRFKVALLDVGILLVLIFWVLEALFDGVLTLWSLDMAGLSFEVVALWETFAIPVVALVVALVIPVVALVGVTLVVCSTMRMAMLVAAIVVSVALICKIVNLVIVALRHLVAEFAFCAKLGVTLHVFLVTLHVGFVEIYHVPRNIAVITVRYHTEVDKLVM